MCMSVWFGVAYAPVANIPLFAVVPPVPAPIVVDPLTRRITASPVEDPKYALNVTRMRLVADDGVMLTVSPVMSPKVADVVLCVTFVTVVLLTLASTARVSITSFVITFHAAAVATSPAASR